MSKCEMCARLDECGDQGRIICLWFKDDNEKEYFDKPDHAARSLANAPQHKKFWDKFNKKEKDSEDN